MFLIGFLIGIPFGILLIVYFKRRCWRSQFYPQRWYWFISFNAHKKGYTKWFTFKLLSKLGFRIQ